MVCELLQDCLPNDHSRQRDAYSILAATLAQDPDIWRIMDLGCGRGDSLDYVLAINPNIHWVGLDVAQTTNFEPRGAMSDFHIFDGIHVPYEDAACDLVFCRRVFEFVRWPHDLIREVARVLRPGGWFLGSTAQFGPDIAGSIFRYTPCGWRFLVEDVAQLKLIMLAPDTDGLTLLLRKIIGKRDVDPWFERETFVNRLIQSIGRVRLQSPAQINATKLRVAGQFSFLARKTGETDGTRNQPN